MARLALYSWRFYHDTDSGLACYQISFWVPWLGIQINVDFSLDIVMIESHQQMNVFFSTKTTVTVIWTAEKGTSPSPTVYNYFISPKFAQKTMCTMHRQKDHRDKPFGHTKDFFGWSAMALSIVVLIHNAAVSKHSLSMMVEDSIVKVAKNEAPQEFARSRLVCCTLPMSLSWSCRNEALSWFAAALLTMTRKEEMIAAMALPSLTMTCNGCTFMKTGSVSAIINNTYIFLNVPPPLIFVPMKLYHHFWWPWRYPTQNGRTKATFSTESLSLLCHLSFL